MLELKNVNQYYGGSHILRDVSLDAKVGEITVVLGRNGVGKTTMLKSIMGVVPIKAGEISLDGQAIHKETSYERVRRGIGFVPQGREIFGRLLGQTKVCFFSIKTRRSCLSNNSDMYHFINGVKHFI